MAGQKLETELSVNVSGFLGNLKAGLDKAAASITAFARGAGGKINLNTKPAEQQLDQLAGKAEKTGGILSKIGGVGGAIGIAAVGAGVASLGKAMIAGNSQMEDYAIQFEVLTGSAEKGKVMFEDLKKLGLQTPFETKDLAQATQVMLGFGESQADIIPNLKMLGDISGGNAEKLQSLSLVFSQVQANGKLMGGDLLQMINAGFNPLLDMSKRTGKSIGELRKEMELGKISFADVELSMKNATSEGGQFFGMMDKTSKSFSGMSSSLQDVLGETMRTLGTSLFSEAKVALKGFLDLLQSPAIQEAVGALGKALGPLVKALAGALAALLPVILQVFGVLGDAIGPIAAALGPIINVLAGVLAQTLKALAPVIGIIVGALTRVMGIVGKVADVLLRALAPVLEIIIKNFGDQLGPVLDLVITLLETLILPLLPLIQVLFALLAPILQLVGAFNNLFLPAITWVSKKLQEALGPRIAEITKGANILIGAISGVVSWIKDAASAIGDFFSGLFDGMSEAERQHEKALAKIDKEKKERAAADRARTEAEGKKLIEFLGGVGEDEAAKAKPDPTTTTGDDGKAAAAAKAAAEKAAREAEARRNLEAELAAQITDIKTDAIESETERELKAFDIRRGRELAAFQEKFKGLANLAELERQFNEQTSRQRAALEEKLAKAEADKKLELAAKALKDRQDATQKEIDDLKNREAAITGETAAALEERFRLFREARARERELVETESGKAAFDADTARENAARELAIDQALRNEKIAAIEDAAERELATKLAVLYDAMAAELAVENLTADEKLAIRERYLQRQIALEVEHHRQSNSLVQAAAAINESLAKSVYDTVKKFTTDATNTKGDEYRRELQILNESLGLQKISRAQHAAAVADLNRKYEGERRQEATNTAEWIMAANEIIGGVMKGIVGELETRNKELFQKFAEGVAPFSEVLLGAATQFTAIVIDAAVAGQNVAEAAGKALLGIAFEFLDKMIPIWSAQILGFSLATPDAIASFGATAIAKWLLLTGLMKAALAGVRALVGLAEGTPFVNGPAGRDKAGVFRLSRGERVVTEGENRRHWHAYEALRKGRGHEAARILARAYPDPSRLAGNRGAVTMIDTTNQKAVAALAKELAVLTSTNVGQLDTLASIADTNRATAQSNARMARLEEKAARRVEGLKW